MLGNTIIIGENHLKFNSIDSTNDYAQLLLSKTNPIEGTAISARFQTQGRGQFGRKWWSEPEKNIIVSIILYPTFLRIDQQFYLSKLVSLACFQLLADLQLPNLAIKWPNDIYVNQKKIGGILIQNQLQGGSIKNSIIGIGMNIFADAFAPEFQHQATSVFLEDKKALHSLDINVLLAMLFEKLTNYYQRLRQNDFDWIDQTYQNHLLNYNEWASYIANDTPFQGKIVGVNEFGQLGILTENTINYYHNGEVQQLIEPISTYPN